MSQYPKTIEELIRLFSRFPGVGPRSAERMVFHLLQSPKEESHQMAEFIVRLKTLVRYCERCFNLSEQSLCDICADPMRDRSVICVVESPRDILAIERSALYKGVYHVLLGRISPLEGIGRKELKIEELLKRLKSQEAREVILATGSDMEGETTALYLTKLVKSSSVKITRISYGIPVGSSLEFADRASLNRAIENRQVVSDPAN